MKVQQLIEILQKFDPKILVVLSKDSEGNSFSPLADISSGNYEKESSYSGLFGLAIITPELEKRGYTDEDIVEGVPAICLWPVN